jgi:shikimate dehydrogenase
MSSLAEEKVSIDGKDILIIGAGGAARAISYNVIKKVLKLSLYDVNKEKAEHLANDLKNIHQNVFIYENIKKIGKPDIIINATPLGLKPGDPLPLNPDFITSDMVIYDLVYKKTKFLTAQVCFYGREFLHLNSGQVLNLLLISCVRRFSQG